MGSLSSVYDRTGFCPHTDACDSYRFILKSESWMERALSRLRRTGRDSLTREEGQHTANGLQERLFHMRRVKERCYCRNRRCLRFWQLEKRAQMKKERESWRMTAPTRERLLDAFTASTITHEST